MREILFRGKRVDNGEWVYGLPYERFGEIQAIRFQTSDGDNIGHSVYAVDPNTVGQYTGLIDKNGNRVYENDIVNCKTKSYLFEGYTIEWYNDDARFVMVKNGSIYAVSESFEYEVVGNIHDNPDMLTDK